MAPKTPKPKPKKLMELIESFGRWTDALNAASNDPTWTRADVIREALARAYGERGKKGETP